MDGTAATPDRYTGRLGLPRFEVLGKVLVWRLDCDRAGDGEGRILLDTEDVGLTCYRELSRGRFGCPGGAPGVRTETPRLWLLHAGGLACGRLEDTRRAKRLISDEGELLSAHLACFAWRTPEAGAALLQAARRRAARLGFPALFVAVAEQDASSLARALGRTWATVAPATVYGVDLEAGRPWNINSSEI
jgi:hypothetical protein